MALITERAGRVYIRIGGNSQETATLVDSLPDGAAIEKDKAASTNPVRSLFKVQVLDIERRGVDRNTGAIVHC